MATSTTPTYDREEALLQHHNTPLQESLLTTRAQTRRPKIEVSHQSCRDKRLRLDTAPITYVTAERIQQTLSTSRTLLVLLDTGSSHTMIKKISLPHGTSLTPIAPKRPTTTNGVFYTKSQVTLSRIKFLEFGNHSIDLIVADVLFF